jgi:regulator of sigma E protease
MTVVLFILVLGALIFVHELGHFLAAKKFHVRVDEFALGFPPRIYGRKWGETLYAINWLPIGGYVKIFGEDPDEAARSGPDSTRSFVNKPWYVQAIILLAGIFGNIVFAWILFSIGFMLGMPTAVAPIDRDTVQNAHLEIVAVEPNSPTEKAGLIAGDILTKIDAAQNQLSGDALTPDTATALISGTDGKPVTFTYERGGETYTKSVTPQAGIVPDEPTRPATGIVMALAGTAQYGFLPSIYQGLLMTFDKTSQVIVGLFAFFGSAFTLHADLSQVTGPVGIANLVGDASRLGFVYLLTFTAFISLNLAVINVLPFPALDGGRLLFVIIELIRRKPISPKIANTFNAVGLIILLILMALVTIHDIFKFF